MEYFKKILVFAKPYKAYALLNVIANVFYALFGTLAMISLFPMLSVLFKQTAPLEQAPIWEGVSEIKTYVEAYLNYFVTQQSAQGEGRALIFMVGLIIGMFFLKNLFGYLAMYFITFLRNGVLKDLRNALYDKSISLPLSYYSEKRKGDSLARITSDVLEIQHSFLSVLELVVREPLTILFTITAMLVMSPKLTAFVFIFLPLAGFLISLLGKSLKRQSDAVQKEQGQFLSILEESLGGLKIIKGFNAESVFGQKFKDSTQRFFDFSNKLLNRQNLASPSSEFLGIAVIGILLWYGGQMVLVEQSLKPELFITYMSLAYQILTPAKAMSKASYGVKKGNAAAERVLEILETKNNIPEAKNAIDIQDFNQSIDFKNVSFKYQDQDVIKNLSLHIEKGKTVALVGQSGSGKSTLANLISRFYEVSEGAVEIDQTDIREIKQRSLRQLMGLVSQDPILFNDSIYNNIALGDPMATETAIVEAAKIANAHEFILQQPQGYQTHIGDGGNKLSGGQKQRLAIARAILKNPPIMILDEATSALDTESEKLVQDALEKLMKNRTSVIIAHRLSTIQHADLIVVLKDGQIVEQGSHQELLKLKGNYHNLVHLQDLNS
ncbi:MAG: ABC transporter ATP-binding protein/permease [Flavobacteriaceae bacterium]|nr:ABC transporter ATP-binding protein/permease [Flavobacteriaceae bacterium]MCI5088928.1 ABC transporter ATP-binding protein/permease [Flavobacteriaceae bacterium]